MPLKINQQFAKLGLQIKDPQAKVNQKSGQFKLEQIPGKLKINSKPVQVEIDLSKARADLNYKDHKLYSKEIAQEGNRTALQGIARRAREGDQLAAIEKEGKPIVQQAKKSLQEKKQKIGLKWKRGAEVNVKSGNQNIKFKPQDSDGVKLESTPDQVKVDLDWGRVKAYQQQKPKLEIRAVDVKR
ncbi:DUF6470 family protein [Halanaerobaculum tunisiense]